MRSHQALAIIPARMGSKRLPGKNMKSLCGKPMVQWAIEAAVQCPDIAKTLVTSDDPAVLRLARDCGVDIVLERPAELATDIASSMDVVTHAMAAAEQTGFEFDEVCLLQATSPLRTAEDISAAFSLYREHNGSASIVSVCELEHPYGWSATLPPERTMEGFVESLAAPQHKYYRLNGAVYLAGATWLKQQGAFLTERSVALVMPKERSIDVDEMMDFVAADAVMKRRTQRDVDG